MVSPNQRSVILNGKQSWPMPGFTFDVDFVNNRYWHNGTVPMSTIDSFTGSPGNAVNTSGIWLPFSTNVARRTNTGLLSESSRTNTVLWNRDLTNAVWVSAGSGVTATKNQVGIDGIVNAASTLTANTNGGTILQTRVLGSATRIQSTWIKRLVGSGNVSMTADGITFTVIATTSVWTRVRIPVQTVLNPVFGFKFDTAGDSVAVDSVQDETSSVDTPTSPIFTTTASVNRPSDVNTLSLTNFAETFAQPNLTLMAELTINQLVNGGTFVEVSDGTANNRYTTNCNSSVSSDGLSGITIVGGGVVGGGYDPLTNKIDTVGKVYRFAFTVSQGSNTVIVGLNGDVHSDVNSVWPTPSGLTTLTYGCRAGGTSSLIGSIRRVVAKPVASSANQILSLSTVSGT